LIKISSALNIVTIYQYATQFDKIVEEKTYCVICFINWSMVLATFSP
jgi:hypothetical protein